MLGIFELIERISDTNSDILIEEKVDRQGAGGQGLHYHSPRKDKPFLKINCAALQTLCSKASFSVMKRCLHRCYPAQAGAPMRQIYCDVCI